MKATQAISQRHRYGGVLRYALIIAGWIILAKMALDLAQMGQLTKSGPGMQVFSGMGVTTHDGMMHGAGHNHTNWLSNLFMWLAMVWVMMLPTIPHGRGTGPRFTLGYVTVWTGAACIGLALQMIMQNSGALSTSGVMANRTIAGTLLIAIGLFQFSPFTQNHLRACRQLSDKPSGFDNGLNHGLHCLSACGILMLSMFVFGLMNILALLVLTAIMTLEKRAQFGGRVARIVGLVLIVLGGLYSFG